MAKIVEQIVNLKAIKQKLDQISAGTVSIIDNLTSWGSDKALSAEQGKALKDLVDTANREIAAIKRILQSSDVNLDTIEEIITKIKAMDNALWGVSTVIESKKNEVLTTMRSELSQKVQELTNLINTKASQADIVDNLTSDATNKALSAKQGKVLKGFVDSVTTTAEANKQKIEAMEPKVTANTSAVATLTSKVSTLETTSQGSTTKLTQLEGKITTETQERKTADGALKNELLGKIQEVETKREERDNWAKTQIETELPNKITQVDGKVTTNTQWLATLKSQFVTFKGTATKFDQANIKNTLGRVTHTTDGWLAAEDFNRVIPEKDKVRISPVLSESAMIDFYAANKLALFPSSQVEFEVSQDGNTWTPFNPPKKDVKQVFSGYITGPATIQTPHPNKYLRITLDVFNAANRTERYFLANKLFIYTHTTGKPTTVNLEKATIGAPNNFVPIYTKDSAGTIAVWPWVAIIQHENVLFWGRDQQTSNIRKLRITMYCATRTRADEVLGIWGIRWYWESNYIYSNNLMNQGTIYSWDWDGNATFPAKVLVNAEPTEEKDVATKKYVDSKTGGVPDTRTGWGLLKFRTGDKTQFDAIATKDANTIYFVKE